MCSFLTNRGGLGCSCRFDGSRQKDGQNAMTFLWMHGREEELVHAMIFVEHVFGIRLEPAHNPVTAFFRLWERVQPACYNIRKVAIEDNLNACFGASLAAMDDGCA